MGRGRITIGLYNSYDQNFREPHRRVIARAGDLARAYDMGLALFGFPIPEDARTPMEIAEWVAGTTSIEQAMLTASKRERILFFMEDSP